MGREKSQGGGLDVGGLSKAHHYHKRNVQIMSVDVPELPSALAVRKPVSAAMGKL